MKCRVCLRGCEYTKNPIEIAFILLFVVIYKMSSSVIVIAMCDVLFRIATGKNTTHTCVAYNIGYAKPVYEEGIREQNSERVSCWWL